jgi:hypothetical protein
MLSMCEFQSLFKKFIAQINRSVLRFKNFPLILRGHYYKNDEFLWILKPCFLLPIVCVKMGSSKFCMKLFSLPSKLDES